MTFDYSIVIRTLGNAGEKYRCMLDAIEHQTIHPREVIVVLPHGYAPDHLLGTEQIVYSDKGMVAQRAAGIAHANGEYLLILDDDLDFPPDFAEKLFQALNDKNLDCVLAFGGWRSSDKPSTITWKQRLKSCAKHVRGAFTGQYFYSHRKSKYFDTIASTGGHRTYVNHPEGLCQTGAGACCLIKASIAKTARLQDEVWLDQGSISMYAAFEDSSFYYKVFLAGGRIAYTSLTDFAHMDAASSHKSKDPLASKRTRVFSIARNRTIFWYRHVWSNHKNLRTLAGGIYGIVNYAIYSIAANIVPRYWPAIAALFKGYSEAFALIKKSKHRK